MRIVHFHTDARMAAKFIAPLMIAERGAGYQTELVSSVRRLGDEAIFIPFDLSVSNFLVLPLALWRIRSHLKVCGPDVVFAHNTKSSLIPLLGAWWAGVHVRVYFNHGVPYIGYRGILRWLLRGLERLNCALATHVVTVSPDMVMLLQDVSPRVKARIILNGSASGVDLQAGTLAKYSRADWRNGHGLRDDDLVVVFVGRPEKRKGFEFVLRLWAENFRESHFKLVLCGPAQSDVVKYLGAAPTNVIGLGFVNNVSEVLACSDLMILPSLHEGLSYACLESQVFGAVIVANDIPGIRCVVENDVSGFLVSDNAPQKYIEIIRKVDIDRASLADMRRQAYRSAERFSRELFMPEYLAFLRDILPR